MVSAVEAAIDVFWDFLQSDDHHHVNRRSRLLWVDTQPQAEDPGDFYLLEGLKKTFRKVCQWLSLSTSVSFSLYPDGTRSGGEADGETAGEEREVVEGDFVVAGGEESVAQPGGVLRRHRGEARGESAGNARDLI